MNPLNLMFLRPKTRIHSITVSLLLLYSLILLGCKTTNNASFGDYVPVTISEIRSNIQKYKGKNISVKGYVLGSEVRKDSKIGQIWIMVIGDFPLLNPDDSGQLIFPEVENKIRVGETGYNVDIINRCYNVSQKLRTSGQLIKVYGSLSPAKPVGHYRGIDLDLTALEINGSIFDTDYDDRSHFKAKAPSVFKKIINGGKGLANLLKTVI